MAVTFNKTKNYYSANFCGKQYVYSVNKYGPLAEEIAKKSFNINKYENALEEAIKFRKQKEIENSYL